MRMPPLLADFIHAGACIPICEKFLTRPFKKLGKQLFSGLFPLIWFDTTRPIFTQFLVVTKWLTGQKEAKMRAKWLPNRITEGCFSALKMEVLSPSQKVIFVWWV